MNIVFHLLRNISAWEWDETFLERKGKEQEDESNVHINHYKQGCQIWHPNLVRLAPNGTNL